MCRSSHRSRCGSTRRSPSARRIPLPLEPNTAWEDGPRAALWLGPDEWLVVGPAHTASEIVAELDRSARGRAPLDRRREREPRRDRARRSRPHRAARERMLARPAPALVGRGHVRTDALRQDPGDPARARRDDEGARASVVRRLPRRPPARRLSSLVETSGACRRSRRRAPCGRCGTGRVRTVRSADRPFPSRASRPSSCRRSARP